MYITRHAEKRIVERLHINKKAVHRHVEKALANGYSIEQTKGSLSAWMMAQMLSGGWKAQNMRAYRNYLYLFSNTDLLLTVYLIPAKIYKDFNNCLEGKKSKHKSHRFYTMEEDLDDYDDYEDDYEDEEGELWLN